MTFKTNNIGDMVAYNHDNYLLITGGYEVELRPLTEWDEQRFELWIPLEAEMFRRRHKYATDEFYKEVQNGL